METVQYLGRWVGRFFLLMYFLACFLSCFVWYVVSTQAILFLSDFPFHLDFDFEMWFWSAVLSFPIWFLILFFSKAVSASFCRYVVTKNILLQISFFLSYLRLHPIVDPIPSHRSRAITIPVTYISNPKAEAMSKAEAEVEGAYYGDAGQRHNSYTACHSA